MWDFLWSGDGELRKDLLVGWETCCRPGSEVTWGLGNLLTEKYCFAVSGSVIGHVEVV